MPIKKALRAGFERSRTILTWVTRDTLRHMREAQLVIVASSLAYITILSVIPAIAVALAIFNAFGGLDRLYETVEPFIIRNLAENASQEAINAIRKAVTNAGALGAGGTIFLIAAVIGMLFNAEKAINTVWQAPYQRSWYQRIASYWLIMTLGPLVLASVLGVINSWAWVKELPPGAPTFAIWIVLFFPLYKFVPHRHVNWISALWSAVFAATAWALARWGYSVYASKVVTYNKIYGSLGAIPIILLWIWINWIIVLTGAALGAAVQKRLELK